MPSDDNFRTRVYKHITPIDFRHLLGNLSHLSNFAQLGAILSSVSSGQCGSFRSILNIFVGQVWVMSSNSEQGLETRYGIVNFGQCSKCLSWHCTLLWLKKVQHCGTTNLSFLSFTLEICFKFVTLTRASDDDHLTDLDPKTRSVIYVTSDPWHGRRVLSQRTRMRRWRPRLSRRRRASRAKHDHPSEGDQSAELSGFWFLSGADRFSDWVFSDLGTLCLGARLSLRLRDESTSLFSYVPCLHRVSVSVS